MSQTILRVVLRPPVLLNHDDLEYKIEHDVPAWHNHLIYLLAYLRITTVTLDCTGSTITVSVEGGHLPYQYSFDNGTTFTDPTRDTSWTYSIESGMTYNIFVKDRVDDFFVWEDVRCGQITVNFEPIYLSLTSTGYITDEESTQHTTAFSVTKNKLDTYNVSATPTFTTSFVGWSYDKPNLYNYGNIKLLSNTQNYTHTFVDYTTVYAIYVKNYDTVSFDMCYFPTASGYSANQTDRDFYCVNCGLSGTTIPIYINGTDYVTYGRDNSIWYSNSGLTILAGHGYYKFSTDENPSLYNIINGVVISVENCNGTKKKTCLSVTTTTTTTAAPITTTTTTAAPISNILLGVSSASDTLAKSYDFGLTVSGLGNTYFGMSTDYFSNCGGILFGSGWNSDWTETQFKYSLDSGTTWTDVPTTIYEPLNTNEVEKVAYNGSIFVAAIDGGSNTLAYSYDGLTWSGLSNTIFSSECRYVMWDGNKFIAGGEGTTNILAYSMDGLNWSGLGYTSLMLTVNNITYNFDNGSPKYVAVGNSPTKPNCIIYSTDGLSWFGAGLPTFTYAGTDVIYANSLFVGVGLPFSAGFAMGYSSDGINWTPTLSVSANTYMYAVAWTGDRYIIGGYGPSSSSILKYTYDLITFYDVIDSFDGVGCIQVFN